MNTLDLESRIRDTLARQAAALQPPDVRPDDARVVVAESPARPPRRRYAVMAAAAALVLIAGAAFAMRNPDAGSVGSSGDGFHFATPTVQLAAASVEVDAGGHTFVPPTDLAVGGDPGTWNEYTTLELEWDAGGVPMRIYMYFASDGTDWWATELRTYDGSPGGEWIEMPGEFFRTPLGSAYTGDVDVDSLHIHGMTLQAFLRPELCADTTKPLALRTNYPHIEAQSGPGLGYSATVTLFNTATCSPVAADGYDVSIVSNDSNVATIDRSLRQLDMGTGVIRIDLHLVGPGETTVHVAVSDRATGELIDQVDIPVTVR